MAGTTIAAKLTLDGSQPVQTVRSFKAQLREAQVDLLQMQAAFGELSPEAITAARNVAMLRDRVQEAREVADLFDPGKKFQAFAGALSTVAAGYGAVQGAMGLFGAESKELEKQLLKVQSAMALAQGLSAIADGAKDFQRLGIIAKEALSGIRTGLLATGIGAFVVALGLAVAYWDDIKAAVTGVTAEQAKLNTAAAKNVETQQKKLDALDSQDNVLKLQGKTEKQILEFKIKQVDATILAYETQAKLQAEQNKAAKESVIFTQSFFSVLIENLTNGLTKVTDLIDVVRGKFGDQDSLTNQLKKKMAGLFPPEAEVKTEGEKTLEAQKKTIAELLDKRAGLELGIKEFNKEAAKREADFRKQLKTIIDGAADDQIVDAELLAERQLKQAYEQQKADIRQTEFSRKQKNELLQALDDKFYADNTKVITARVKELNDTLVKLRADDAKSKKEAQDKQFATDIEKANQRASDIYAIDKEIDINRMDDIGMQQAAQLEQLDGWYAARFEIVKNNADAEANLTDEYERLKTKITTDANNARLESLSGALGSISQAIGQQTVAGKALAVVSATIDTYVGATKALAQGGIFGYIGAAAIIATGLANVRKIVATQVPGQTGGTSAPSIDGSVAAPLNPIPNVVSTSLPQDQINKMGNAAVRAYVVESDVTSNVEKVSRINRQARLGG